MSVITATSNETLTLSLRNTDGSPIALLQGIARHYQGNSDLLSRRITRWVKEAFQLEKSTRSESPKQREKLALEKINELVTDILTNPLTGKTLKNPVIGSNTWEWEQEFYSVCQTIFQGKFPLDQTAMEESPRPHEYAAQMISFVRNITNLSEPVESQELALIQNSGMDSSFLRMVYLKLVKDAAKIRRQYEAQEKMLNAALTRSTHLESDNAQLMDVLERSIEQEESFHQELDFIRDAYQGNLDEIARQNAFRDAAHEQQVIDLRDQIEAQENANHAVADTLRNQLGSMQESFQSTVSTLSGQISTLSQHTQHLQGQVSAAHSQISSLDTAVTKTRGDLAAAEKKNQVNVKEMDQQNQRLAGYERRVQQLQRDLDNADSGSCLIL